MRPWPVLTIRGNGFFRLRYLTITGGDQDGNDQGGCIHYAGGGMLESILGGSQSATQTEIAQKSGIEPQKVMRILTMLAPIVLSAYARYKQAPPTSPNASQTAERSGGGLLGDIIDRVT